MIEQYIFNLITTDTTLQTLLSAGSGKYHLYPGVIPRGVTFNQAVTFSQISSFDSYPNIKSVTVQFTIFAETHIKVVEVAQALYNLMNEDNIQTSGGVEVVFSQRSSETDLGYDYDDKLYQREASYYFKLR